MMNTFTLTSRTFALLLLIVLLSRVFLFLIVAVSLYANPQLNGDGLWQGFPGNIWLDGWARWDSGWYADIALNGYISAEGIVERQNRNTAFFPLYPLMIYAVNLVVGNVYVAGLLVSNTCFFVAIICMYQLSRFKTDEQTAFRASVLLCIFPYAFFFNAMYSESLFLMLAVAALLAAEKTQWLIAGILAGMLGATRPMGILILAPLCLIYMSQIHWNWRSVRWDVLWLSLGLVGICAYGAFQFLEYGTPFEFVKVQQTSDWATESRLFPINEPSRVIYLVSIFLMGFLLFRHFAQFHAYAVWGLLMCGVSFMRIHGFGRYVLVIFPCFLALALLLSNRWFTAVVSIMGFVGMCLLAIQFAHWEWVA